MDLTDAAAARSLQARTKPQLIYHLARMVSARRDRELTMPMLQARSRRLVVVDGRRTLDRRDFVSGSYLGIGWHPTE